jgi:hypothetical protein
LNPRINVTLSPSLDMLVGRLASFERVSKSMVLRELLEAAEPSLRQAVALMEAAQGAGVKARQNMADDLQKTLKAAESVSVKVHESLASQTRDLVAEAETIRGRRPPRAKPKAAVGALGPDVRKSGRPPISNRGVKS